MPLKLFAHTLIAAAFATVLVCNTASQAQNKPREWLIEQNFADLGDTRLYVSEDAIALVCPAKNLHILTKSPDWQVHCFNTVEKVEWIGHLNQFSGIAMANPFAVPYGKSARTWRLNGQTKVRGIACLRYGNMQASGDKLLTAQEPKTNKNCAEMVARFYHTPILPEIPLYHAIHNGVTKYTRKSVYWMDSNIAGDLRDGPIEKLKTLSCQPKAFNAADFEYPKGYKRIGRLIEISYSSREKSNISDFMDNIGFTSDRKLKVKKP